MKNLPLVILFLMIHSQIMAAKFKITTDENNIQWVESKWGQVKSKDYLKNFIMPRVVMKNTNLYGCISYAASRSRELDTVLDPRKKGVKMRLALNEKLKNAKNINYQARNISLLTYFKEISKQANVNCYLTTKGVLLCPDGILPPDIKNNKAKILETIYKAKKVKQEKAKPPALKK